MLRKTTIQEETTDTNIFYKTIIIYFSPCAVYEYIFSYNAGTGFCNFLETNKFISLRKRNWGKIPTDILFLVKFILALLYHEKITWQNSYLRKIP